MYWLAIITVRLSAADIAGRTLAEALAHKGFGQRNPGAVGQLHEAAERYFDWRG